MKINAQVSQRYISRNEATAALTDDIYSMLQDVQMAKFSLNELLDGYFNEDPDGSAKAGERLMVEFPRAVMQAKITNEFLHRIKAMLECLDAEANIYVYKPEGGTSALLQQP